MDEKRLSIKEYLQQFELGVFSAADATTQIKAGWYDWFCKDTSLRGKTYQLTKYLKTIVWSKRIDLDKQYVFFKNNCPVAGSLYDDFRICDMVTGDVVWTITPHIGYDSYKRAVKDGTRKGLAEVWGKVNDFKEPVVVGKWSDVKQYFLQ